MQDDDPNQTAIENANDFGDDPNGPEQVPVAVAWSRVMGSLRAIAKGECTTGGPIFNFRGIDAVMNAVGPVLRQHGVSVIPNSVTGRHRDYTSKSGAIMHEAIVEVGYLIVGPIGDTIQGASIGESSDASDKSTTQAMSVAYRTFLLQSLTMPTNDPDPDHSDAGRRPHDSQRPPAQHPPTEDPFTTTERVEAWNMCHTRMPTVAEPNFSNIVAWLEAQTINPETLTRAHAKDWWLAMEQAPAVTPQAATGKVPGWKSDAKRIETHEALNYRQQELLKRFPLMVPIDAPDPATMTVKESEDWLAAVIQGELEAPF